MASANAAENVSWFSRKVCVNVCGMCPHCVFAQKLPDSAPWKTSEEYKRRFLVGFLHRCANTDDLESVDRMLSVTSSQAWVTYRKSGSPAAALQDASSARLGGEALRVQLDDIWRWFSSSPDWIKSSYLCRAFSRCDLELLRMLSNLTSVLLVRQQRGLTQLRLTKLDPSQQNEEPEDPALMVVPGSSKSVSGVSKYRDFICCLPVNLSKRILGLLDESTLRCCKSVCQYWQHLAEETWQEVQLRGIFNKRITAIMESCRSRKILNPGLANFVGVPVPLNDEEQDDIQVHQKEKLLDEVSAKIKIKTVQMEERNVYCGAYFTEVLLNQEDSHRVLDYRGGLLMAMSSKNRFVHLLHVASETKTMGVLKGHVGMVRAVLLCEDRDLLITAGSDASIRFWNMRTDRCDMVLHGHANAINCLDVNADTLVSGGKDCTVRVWSLHTGRRFDNFNFKHPRSVQCVKVNRTTIYSSCNQGNVKIWNMEKASLLRVINGHKSSVKCLFVDEWHLVTGDTKGKVMAWSVGCEAAGCLKTFNHRKEIKSLTLTYLRLITGSSDGQISIFNFLTGDCLRCITLGSESGSLLSLHFQDRSILVNTKSSVLLYHFAKVFWNYTDPAKASAGDVVPQDCLVSEESAGIVRTLPRMSIQRCDVNSQSQKNPNSNIRTPARRCFATRSTCGGNTSESIDTCKQSVIQSEKAACERMKKRGPHHPPTRDAILLRVGVSQRLLRVDEVGINMEKNARLRDRWGPREGTDLNQNPQSPPCPQQPSHDSDNRAKSCQPILKRTASPSMKVKPQRRALSTAPDSTKRHHLHLTTHCRQEDGWTQ